MPNPSRRRQTYLAYLDLHVNMPAELPSDKSPPDLKLRSTGDVVGREEWSRRWRLGGGQRSVEPPVRPGIHDGNASNFVKILENPQPRVGTSAINAELAFVMARKRCGARLDRQGREG